MGNYKFKFAADIQQIWKKMGQNFDKNLYLKGYTAKRLTDEFAPETLDKDWC